MEEWISYLNVILAKSIKLYKLMDFIMVKNKYYKGVIKGHKCHHTNIKLHSSIDIGGKSAAPDQKLRLCHWLAGFGWDPGPQQPAM